MFESRVDIPPVQRPVFSIGDSITKKDKVSIFLRLQLISFAILLSCLDVPSL